MNKRSLPSLLAGLCFLLAGIIFITFCKSANVFAIVETVLGIVFIVPSLIYVCLVLSQQSDKRGATDYIGIFPAVGGLCFGVVLVLRPSVFDSALGIVFSILLIVLGIFHIVLMAVMAGHAKTPLWSYVPALAVAVAGIVLLLKEDVRSNQQVIVLVTGIAFVLSFISTLIEVVVQKRVTRGRSQLEAASGETIDVTPEQ